MINNNRQFDKELHDKLSTEELPFDPVAWDMMEERLDKRFNRFIFWIPSKKYLISGLSILSLALLIYWPYHYNNFIDKVHSEVVSQRDYISQSNIDASTTSEIDTKTVGSILEPPLLNEKENDISLMSLISEQKNLTVIDEPLYNANDDRTDFGNLGFPTDRVNPNNNAAEDNTVIRPTIEYGLDLTTKVEADNDKIVSNSKKAENLKNSTTEEIDELSILGTKGLSHFAHYRAIDLDLQFIELQEKIDRPKHQINLAIGAGMTQLDIDDPSIGVAKPVAVTNQEIFISLSYLYRIHRNLGIEIGAQGAVQFQKIARYFEAEEFGLPATEYGRSNVNAYEGKYELFSNIHFFLPLSQRSEIDIYGGFYALNPFQPSGGSWSSGGGVRSIVNEELTLINTSVGDDSDIFNGGRIKLGLNYNFLTNKLNNVGIGIAYMQQVDNIVEGNYRLIQSSEEAQAAGNLRANPSGFKVQVTYGFGMKRLPWNRQISKKAKTKLSNPWYVGLRYGTKSYSNSAEIYGDFPAPANKYQSIILGHYINQKMAFEFGLEHSQFIYFTPFGENLLIKSQSLLTIPFALRYDLLQNDRFSLYSKGVFSTDFRLDPNRMSSTGETGFITDENNLLLNAGIETGIDFKLFRGFNIGFVGKYNHAFERTALIQYPISRQNEIEFRDINLTNKYVSWGIELKYRFNG